MELIEKIIQKYNPYKMYIECNGMKDPENIINIFYKKIIKSKCRLDDIVSIVDCKTFEMYLKNMEMFVTNHIYNSKKVVLRNVENIDDKKRERIKRNIRNINETVCIYEQKVKTNEDKRNEDEYINLTNRYSVLKTGIILSLILFTMTFAGTLITFGNDYNTGFLKNLCIKFISIIIEGMPFILIGSFISAIIHILVSKDKIIKFVPKNKLLACIIASCVGIIMPICDCSTIPVMKSIIRKGVNVGAAVTFMLAAPIVNPISIISTIYAFKGMTYVVIYRLAAGIVISIVVGLIISYFYKNQDQFIYEEENLIECQCDFCMEKGDKIEKAKSIFIYTCDEFFKVGKFFIIGSMLSVIIQNIISVTSILPNDDKSSLMIMMILAFLFSLCSTSDSFVGRSFINGISINSVMGFLVFGPMLDVKNVLMLLGSFKKKFVFNVVAVTFIVTYFVLINFKLA